MSKRILFLDSTSPKPYDANSLKTEPLGGTEATCIRVAEGLASRGYDVIVAQRDRYSSGEGKAAYIGFDHLDQIQDKPHAIVALRQTSLIPFAQRKWADTRKFLWLHDFNQQDVVRDYAELRKASAKVVCVSQTHKTLTTSAILSQIQDARGITIDYIYNPIADDLAPDTSTVFHRKLVFFSSPHKGLEQALNILESLHRFDSTYELHIANPGYFKSYNGKRHGVVNHGKLTHDKVIEQVRGALCVLHPNFVFPETFGIVTAESLAVGTPILTTPFGATREVMGENGKYLIKTPDLKPWVDRILQWGNGERPVMQAPNPEFRLSAVLTKWERMFQ